MGGGEGLCIVATDTDTRLAAACIGIAIFKMSPSATEGVVELISGAWRIPGGAADSIALGEFPVGGSFRSSKAWGPWPPGTVFRCSSMTCANGLGFATRGCTAGWLSFCWCRLAYRYLKRRRR